MNITQQDSLGDTELVDFLKNAPKYFREGERIKKFQLKNGDHIHCVLWNYHFYITGTDIVKILIWRFQNAGRQMGNMKKFEEGIFSDLRNLKPGIDATLESPRSSFLEYLYKNGCIRTQKKQKVFYWYSVPHDALYCDALERDLRRDTSIYNYNSYTEDRRPFQNVPYPSRKFANSFPFNTKPNNLPYNNNTFQPIEIPRNKPEQVKNDIFNIKNTLFSDFSLSNNPFEPTNKSNIAAETSSTIFPMSFEPKKSNVTSEFFDFEDDSKLEALRSKIGKDLKKKFEDFDLDQLSFLKERCIEAMQTNCEKKSFNEKMNDNGANSNGQAAKVQFIGMDKLDINE